MADWLKIPSKKKRREQDIPEPYEIVCVCGVSLSGYRRKAPYRHTCQQCCESYFILPRNAYPPLKARKKKKQIPTQQRIMESLRNSTLVTRLRERGKEKRVARKAQAEGAAVAQPELSPFELPPPRTRWITPFRAILAGIALIVGVTGYGIWWSHQLDQAEVTLKTATEAGEELLQQGDLLGASAAYQDAFQAVKILGRTDQSAFEISQKTRELKAMTTQAVSPLFEIADEAADQLKQHDFKSWESLFDVRYAGTWMIFETTLTPVPTKGEEEQSRYRLNLPVILDEYMLDLELTSPAFQEYLTEHAGQSLIFAAPIQKFEQDTSQPGKGVIVLDGKAAFLWSHPDLYEKLGIQYDEYHERGQVERILGLQTQFLERAL